MDTIAFRATLRDFGRFAGRMKQAKAAFSDLRGEMEQVGTWLLADASRRLGLRKSSVGRGRLMKSLRAKAFKRAVTISSVLPYARIQQIGGTVYPRVRRWLAIPLREQDKRVGLWPKHVSGKPGVSLWFHPIAPGKALLFYRKSAGTGKRKTKAVDSYPRWLLLKKATITGRPYLLKSRQLITYMRGLFRAKLRRLRG